MPPVLSYQDAYNQLGSAYDPQVSSVNQQIATLQPQQDAQQAGLDQAKVNAFRDITTSANAKGMLFSGFSPDQQAQYVGTKYLPAVANLKQTFANQRTTLLDKINQINAQRSQQASQSVAAAQQAAETAAYHNAQLQLGYARLSASNANAAASRASKTPAPLTQQQIVGAIRQGLDSVKGNANGGRGDNYVSPQDFAAAYHTFASAGYNPGDFYKYFQGYMNPNNHYYDYAIKTYKG